jgi:hypothetical protein
MLVEAPYNRENALLYAKRYAFSQNPIFGDFRDIGGNCTNFVSQCVYAGSCRMNYTKTFGWYYVSLDNRAPAWTGVEFFYNFITSNEGVGPFGREIPREECEIGDAIQLGNSQDGYYHTLLVVGSRDDDILVAAQTDNALMRPLSTYSYEFARFIKIDGVRMNSLSSSDCFSSLYEGVSIIPDEFEKRI